MKYIIFIIPCLITLYDITCNLIWTDQTFRKYIKGVSKYDFRIYELRSSVSKIMLGLCFIYSYPYVAFPVLWLVLGLMALLIPVFFFINKNVNQNVEQMFKNMNEDKFQKGIKKRRVQSIYKLILLIVWLVSWRTTFT